jgi:predicted kinase
MSTIYVMTGLPGSGKTSFSKKFAEALDLQYFGIDDFYEHMNGDECNRSNKFDVWMMFYRAIHNAGVAGKDIIIDVNSPTVVDRAEFINWFPEFDKRYLLYMDTPFEVCAVNNHKYHRQIGETDMFCLYGRYQPPTLEEVREYKWAGIETINYITPSAIVWEA